MTHSHTHPIDPVSHRPRDECGIFAVYGHPEAVKVTYFGLYALQHRGQESAGIVASDGVRVVGHKAMGLVPEVFDEQILGTLRGHMALGHVRYSTTGSSLLINAQPFRIMYSGKSVAVAHNGNIVNAKEIREELENRGSIFQTSMDSELVLHLAARSFKSGPSGRARPPERASASLSSSILPDRTVRCSARTSTSFEKDRAGSWLRRFLSRRIW